ncbi:MAG: PKD domain-containing protein [Verrucomicrobiota bacterium]
MNHPPLAGAGRDCVVFVDEPVAFDGWGSSADDTVVEYQWDFESDGVADFASAFAGVTTHRFSQPGIYKALLTVRDSQGTTARAVRQVTVIPKEPVRSQIEVLPQRGTAACVNPADGIPHRYAILFNGGAEARFWTDVTLAYSMLTDGYGLAPDEVFVLNGNGTNPDGQNPGGMIDFAATLESLQTVFAWLGATTDADDELFFWITGHGRGYSGPLDEGGRFRGYLDGRASVDPGDEPDYSESDFKLRSLFTPGDFASNHGLSVWKVFQKRRSATVTDYYRNEYVSHFQNVFVAGRGLVSDNDVFIERFVDYLQGDTDKNGIIDTGRGERMDYDGDGIPPYDPSTGAFDEDDWGPVDLVEDDFNNINSGVPDGGRPYQIFDEGFKGKLCIDLAYDGVHLQADGRDEDGEGLFDWLDANRDGDTDDVISVDEAVCAASDDIYDDALRPLLNLLPVARITIVAEPCFSGGLVEDLSGPQRVICAATIEEAKSWGNGFIRGFVAALQGRNEYGFAVLSDSNGDGEVSMLEAFNYAASIDPYNEIPQYDDNGDGLSQTDPVPADSDGGLGANTFLRPPPNFDGDADGMPDSWERAHGLDPAASTDGALDPDGDGSCNLAEYLAQTDPRDPTSALLVTGAVPDGPDLVISFRSAAGKVYRVEKSSVSPGGPWVAALSSLIGTGGELTATMPGVAAEARVFYRVVVQP